MAGIATTMQDNCCGTINGPNRYNYHPYKPITADLDGNGWPDEPVGWVCKIQS